MTDHPSINFARLLDWIEGRLDAQEAASLAEELRNTDEQSLAQLAWMRAFQQASAALVIETPPPTLRAALIERFAATHRQPGTLQRILMLLSFDSARQPALSGARGAESTRRQLIFSSDAADIAINLTPRAADQQLDLSGQIFKKNDRLAGTLEVRLLHDDQVVATLEADELGEFSFPALLSNHYSISVSDGHSELLCGPMSIQGDF